MRPSSPTSLVRATVVAVATTVVVALLGLADIAWAHAALSSTDPPAGAVLAEAPGSITLTFSESVNTVQGSIRLLDGGGDPITVGAADQRSGPTTITVDLPPLDDGTYVVAWRAVSADSHPVNGAYSFSIGVAGTVDPGSVDAIVAADRPAAWPEAVLGVGRALSFAGVGVLTGVLLVLAVCGMSLVRGRVSVLMGVGLAVGMVGTLLMFAGQAEMVAGAWWRWRSVIDSAAGWWWFVRLAALAMSAAVVSHADVLRWRARALVVVWATALAAVTAAGGHGLTGRLVAIGFASSVVHLVAMALWIGGVAVVAAADPATRALDVKRFSPVALGSVVVLALTGTLNAWRQSGDLDALMASRYGHWLLVKVTVVVAIVAIVAVAGVSRTLTRSHPSSPGLPRTVTAEWLGFAVVFAATAVLVNSPPPYDARRGLEPAAGVVTAVEGGRELRVSVVPTTTAGTLTIHIADPDGVTPLAVSVDATLEAAGVGPIDIAVEPDGGGGWSSSGLALPLAGDWTIRVVARFGEFDATTFAVTLAMTAPGSPR